MIPPYTYAVGRLAEEHEAELKYQQDQGWLIGSARPVRVRLADRVLDWLGTLMVCCGERMRARSAPIRVGLRHSLLK